MPAEVRIAATREFSVDVIGCHGSVVPGVTLLRESTLLRQGERRSNNWLETDAPYDRAAQPLRGWSSASWSAKRASGSGCADKCGTLEGLPILPHRGSGWSKWHGNSC